MRVFIAASQLYVRNLRALAVLEDAACANETKKEAKRNENEQVTSSFLRDTLLANLCLEELFSEILVVEVFLVAQRIDVLALSVKRACKANSFAPSIKDRIVSVEKVESKNPVTNVRCVHQTQLALASRVLYVGTARKLVSDVVNSERDVFEGVKVFTGAHRGRQPIL